jgi:hypothetical protein
MSLQILGLSLFGMAYSLKEFYKENPKFREQFDRPPALTDLGRGSSLANNLYVASITLAASLAIMLTHQHAKSQTLLGIALPIVSAGGFITTAVMEGNLKCHEHAGGLIVGVTALAIWACFYGPSLFVPQNFRLTAVFTSLIVYFIYLYQIRKRSNAIEVQRRFVWGEYYIFFLGLPLLIVTVKTTLGP